MTEGGQHFNHRFIISRCRASNHGDSHFAQRADKSWKKSASRRVQPGKCFHQFQSVFQAFGRIHKSRTKHVRSLKRQLQKTVLCFSFNPGPHDPAFFRAVRAGSENVTEYHVRILFRKNFRRMRCEIVCEFVIFRPAFFPARGPFPHPHAAGIRAALLRPPSLSRR